MDDTVEMLRFELHWAPWLQAMGTAWLLREAFANEPNRDGRDGCSRDQSHDPP